MSANLHLATNPRMLALAARFAWQTGIDADDAKQALAEIVLTYGDKYDASRGASPETYFLGKLKNWCLNERSKQRFGVQLDDDELELADELAEDTQPIAAWRADDNEITKRTSALDPRSQRLVALLADGKSCDEAASALGVTVRRVYQLVGELTEMFTQGRIPAGARQLCLFGEAA